MAPVCQDAGPAKSDYYDLCLKQNGNLVDLQTKDCGNGQVAVTQYACAPNCGVPTPVVGAGMGVATPH
jgi:hypothetical protein